MPGRKRMMVGIVSGIVIITGVMLIVRVNRNEPLNYGSYSELIVSSPSFVNGIIPVEFTGDGEDKSPKLVLENLSEEAVSIAVIMDDLDVPVAGIYNHWIIWNIPPQNVIPERIAHGAAVEELGSALQGVGYGRHRYRGPKPPFGSHRYQFHVFVLDTMLDLNADSHKKDLLADMDGHILQYGSVIGSYPGVKTDYFG